MSFAGLSERFERAPKDTVGLEFIENEVRAARLKLSNGAPQLVGAEVLQREKGADHRSGAGSSPLAKRTRSRAGSLAFHSPATILKMLTFPATALGDLHSRIVPAMGVETPEEYRISHRVIRPTHHRQEARVLCVAVPRSETDEPLHFCHSGLPAPYSLECAGLAAFSSLEFNLGHAAKQSSYGAIHFGTHETVAALFHLGFICLIRQVPFGSNVLHESVCKHLGLSQETARQIVADPSFDISEAIGAELPPLVKQLVISRDFIERRENCHIDNFYVSGELSRAKRVLAELEAALNTTVQAWDPFAEITGADTVGIAESDHWRYAVPIGAALASLEVI